MLNFGLLAQWVLSKRELPNLNRAGCYQQPGMGEVLLYIDVLCIIDLMVLQHRADTEGKCCSSDQGYVFLLVPIGLCYPIL